jgi:hypothetical protein
MDAPYVNSTPMRMRTLFTSWLDAHPPPASPRTSPPLAVGDLEDGVCTKTSALRSLYRCNTASFTSAARKGSRTKKVVPFPISESPECEQ